MKFVQRLHDALTKAGREPAWDQDHAVVPFSAPYRTQIAAAIAASDKFIFVISPDSLDSGPCAEELTQAEAAGKHVIPLLRRSTRQGQQRPDALAERNWIFFDDDTRFDGSLYQLIEVLDTDLDYVKTHTRFLMRARQWAETGSDRSGLLRGADLRAAEEWLADAGSHPKTPPTARQRQYIATSRRASDRTARVQRSVLATGLAIAIALAAFAFVQRGQAIHERDLAVYNQVVAEAAQAGTTNPSLAAELNLAAYRMRQSPDVASRLVGTENTALVTARLAYQGFNGLGVYSPDGRSLAIASDLGSVQLWNVTNPANPTPVGEPLKTPSRGFVPPVAFSPDSHTLALAAEDGAIRLWNVTDPRRPTPFGNFVDATGSGGATAVAFNADADTLAVGYRDGTVRLWDIANPADPAPVGKPLPTTKVGTVHATTFSANGGTLAVDYQAGSIQLWDITDPWHPTPLGAPVKGSTGGSAVALSPDGRTLVVGTADGKGQLWDMTIPASPVPLLDNPINLGNTGSLVAAAFSPDGHALALGWQNGQVWFWDLASGYPLPMGQPFTNSAFQISSMAFGPGGRILAITDDVGTSSLWSVPQISLLSNTSAYFNSVAFSPGRRTMATDGSEGLELWDVADPTHPTMIGRPVDATMQSDYFQSVVFSPDGHTLATGTANATVQLWNAADPADLRLLSQPLTGSLGRGDLFWMGFSPDGRTLAIDNDGAIQLWAAANPVRPKPLGQPLDANATSVAFSPDGRTLAVAHSDGSVRLWDVADPSDPRPLSRLTTGGNGSGPGAAIAFSPDGRILAAGGEDGSILLWDVRHPASPRPLAQPVTGSAGRVLSIAFSPDGHTLVSGGEDHMILLWDVTNPADPTPLGQPLAASMSAVGSLAFSPDGQVLVTVSQDGGALQLWNLNVGAAIARICAETRSSLTSAVWRQYIPELTYESPCANVTSQR